MTRRELLDLRKSGDVKQFSDFVRAKILDRGHEIEALTRPIVEKLFGVEFFSVVYTKGRESASVDGITEDGALAFECKQWSKELAESVRNGILPEHHKPQVQQTLYVSEADELIFAVSDGKEVVTMKVLPDPDYWETLVAGWRQFEKDLETHEIIEKEVKVIAAPVLALPAMTIQVGGSLTVSSNLSAFGSRLKEFIDGINKAPYNDQEFVDCEDAVKTLEKAEKALQAASASALAQTASVDEMVRTVQMYVDLAASTRIQLKKIIDQRKAMIRTEFMTMGRNAVDDHVAHLNARIGKMYMPPFTGNFAEVIKSKRTTSSLRAAIEAEIARVKVEATKVAERIAKNCLVVDAAGDEHKFLFADMGSIVLKAPDDFANLVQSRIDAYKRSEAERIERETAAIRAQEQKAAEDRAAKAVEAEREKIRAEERAKAQAEAAADVMKLAGNKVTVDIKPDSDPVRFKPASALTETEQAAQRISFIKNTITASLHFMTLAQLEDVAIFCDAIIKK